MSKVLITRPRKQAKVFADTLAEAGFKPIFFPVIQIRAMDDLSPLDEAMPHLDTYAWVIFTSANAVDVFFDSERTKPFPPQGGALLCSDCSDRNIKIAAVGPKTEASLKTRGVTVDFVPEEYVGDAILSGLGDIDGKWILLPRAEIAREILPQQISAAGGIVHEIAIYQTLPGQPDEEGLAALRAGVDVVSFTSPSTVKNFLGLIKQAGIDPFNLVGNPVFACIGPITKKAAEKEGLTVAVMPENYTVEGMVESIINQKPIYD
jgi:uroporphyrinogen III methyltransferase/synthase